MIFYDSDSHSNNLCVSYAFINHSENSNCLDKTGGSPEIVTGIAIAFKIPHRQLDPRGATLACSLIFQHCSRSSPNNIEDDVDKT